MASDVHRGMNSLNRRTEKKIPLNILNVGRVWGMLEKKEQWQSKERWGTCLIVGSLENRLGTSILGFMWLAGPV